MDCTFVMLLLSLVLLPLLSLDILSPANAFDKEDVGVAKVCTFVMLLLPLLSLDILSPANVLDKEDVGVGKVCTFVMLLLLPLAFVSLAAAFDREAV